MLMTVMVPLVAAAQPTGPAEQKAAPVGGEPLSTWLAVDPDDPEQAREQRLEAVLRALI